MGVLPCDRNGCTNIMCNRSILFNRFRICDRCWNELVAHKNRWSSHTNPSEVHSKIEWFMNDEIHDPIGKPKTDVDAEFERLTEQDPQTQKRIDSNQHTDDDIGTGVHASHCCDKHGCKYGDPDCPVFFGNCKQHYPCETCGMTEEGHYSNGGYYDGNFIWHE